MLPFPGASIELLFPQLAAFVQAQSDAAQILQASVARLLILLFLLLPVEFWLFQSPRAHVLPLKLVVALSAAQPWQAPAVWLLAPRFE